MTILFTVNLYFAVGLFLNKKTCIIDVLGVIFFLNKAITVYTPYNRLSGQQMLSGIQIISTSHGMTGNKFFDQASKYNNMKLKSPLLLIELCGQIFTTLKHLSETDSLKIVCSVRYLNKY